MKGKVRKMNWQSQKLLEQGNCMEKSQLYIVDWEVNSLKGMHADICQGSPWDPGVITLQFEYHCSSIHKVLSGFSQTSQK